MTIGFEAQLSLEPRLAGQDAQYDTGFWFDGVERLFLSIYVAEALFRLFALGLPLLTDRWFILDLVLVGIGSMALVIIPLASEEWAGFEKVLVARGLRLLRLLRVLRMFHQFKIIWRLVYGFLTAWETIFASALLITILLFVFSCIAIEVIAKDKDLLRPDSATMNIVEENFFGVGRSMLTLGQFVTLDGITEVAYPLMYEKPWLVIYFYAVLLVISMGLLNLITAALVENAMENAAASAEEERYKLKKKVRGVHASVVKRRFKTCSRNTGHFIFSI